MASGKNPPIIVLVVLIAIPVAAWRGFIYWFQKHEKSSIAAGRDKARPYLQRAEANAKRYRDEVVVAIKDAYGKDLRGDGGPCPIRVPTPPPMNGSAKTSFDNADEAVNAAMGGMAFFDKMQIVDAKKLDEMDPAAPKSLLYDVRSLDGDQSISPEDLLARAEKLANTKLTWDLVLIREREQSWVIDEAAKTYKPGRIEGRAYVYDYEKHAIVCAADVDAQNSDSVKFAIGNDIASTALIKDLRAEALRNAAEKMAAIK